MAESSSQVIRILMCIWKPNLYHLLHLRQLTLPLNRYQRLGRHMDKITHLIIFGRRGSDAKVGISVPEMTGMGTVSYRNGSFYTGHFGVVVLLVFMAL